MKDVSIKRAGTKTADMLIYLDSYFFEPDIQMKVKRSYKRTRIAQILFGVSVLIIVLGLVGINHMKDLDVGLQLGSVFALIFGGLFGTVMLVFGFLNRGNPWFIYKKWYKKPAPMIELQYKLRMWDGDETYDEFAKAHDDAVKMELMNNGYSAEEADACLADRSFLDETLHHVDVDIDRMI